MTYQELEYSADFYGEVKPEEQGLYDEPVTFTLEWHAWGEGDKDGPGPVGDVITLQADHFPIGSKLTVEVPLCPECQWPAPVPSIDGYKCYGCEFDWQAWALEEYG